MFHSFELHLAFILSHKHHFSLVWLFSCLKSPKENKQLEVKNHTYSLPILHPHYTPGRDSIVFFLMEGNRHWVKTQNQEETWVLQDGGRWSHLGKAPWQREPGLATGRGRRCGLGQCGQEEWGRHGSQAAHPALSRAGSRPSGEPATVLSSSWSWFIQLQLCLKISRQLVCSLRIQFVGGPDAASRYRLELYWMIILRQADQTLAHFTKDDIERWQNLSLVTQGQELLEEKRGKHDHSRGRKAFALCVSRTYGCSGLTAPHPPTYLHPVTQFPEDTPNGRYSWKEAAGWNRGKSWRSQTSGFLSPPLPLSRARKQTYIICALMPPSLKAEKYLSCVSVSHCIFIWQREQKGRKLSLILTSAR